MTTSMSMWRKEALLKFPRCWQLTCFSATAFLRRNSNTSSYAGTTEEGPVQRTYPASLTMNSAGHLSLRNLITAESFHIWIENNAQQNITGIKIFKYIGKIFKRTPTHTHTNMGLLQYLHSYDVLLNTIQRRKETKSSNRKFTELGNPKAWEKILWLGG